MNTTGLRTSAGLNARLARQWSRVSPHMLPFADAVSAGLPLSRLLRLALFQVSVGMAAALLVGTLNRVMIIELGVPAWLVALMVALPLLVAPFRALIGHRSDTHRSLLGWRRVPYLWMGTLMQFGGLAILPFSLILLSRDAGVSATAHAVGLAAAMLAFVLVGLGMQTTQTAGLALATDQATPQTRPRVVALMYVMLLLGMVGAIALFSAFVQVWLIWLTERRTMPLLTRAIAASNQAQQFAVPALLRLLRQAREGRGKVGVREALGVREHREQGAFCERAVSPPCAISALSCCATRANCACAACWPSSPRTPPASWRSPRWPRCAA